MFYLKILSLAKIISINGRTILMGKTVVLGEKPDRVPLHTPQIPHQMPWD
jgi:hypothetical protein